MRRQEGSDSGWAQYELYSPGARLRYRARRSTTATHRCYLAHRAHPVTSAESVRPSRTGYELIWCHCVLIWSNISAKLYPPHSFLHSCPLFLLGPSPCQEEEGRRRQLEAIERNAMQGSSGRGGLGTHGNETRMLNRSSWPAGPSPLILYACVLRSPPRGLLCCCGGGGSTTGARPGHHHTIEGGKRHHVCSAARANVVRCAAPF